MILILSNRNDYTSDYIIDWLAYFDAKYLRWEDLIKIKDSYVSNDNAEYSIEHNGEIKQIDLNDVTGFLYRKGVISVESQKMDQNEEELSRQIQEYQNQEFAEVISIFLDRMAINTIGNIAAELHLTKVKQLNGAVKVGLKIPQFIITGHKKKLMKFHSSNKDIITKPLSKHFNFNDGNIFMAADYNKPLSYDFIESLPDTFASSFFQGYVNKRFEIRTFVLKGELYSMAIFSQSNSDTKYDYRNDDEDNANRLVPFRHNEEDRIKIVELAKRFNMKTMSIDFIMSDEGELFFLEINPTGQFGWLSDNCNYFLEKKIAKSLLHA